MIYIFLGFLVLLVGIFVLDRLSRAEPHKISQAMKYGIVAGLGVLALFLLMTGRFAAIVPVLVAAIFALWRGFAGKSKNNSQPSAAPRSDKMDRAEALRVLGLGEGASDDDIRAAHRNLMRKVHPDHGGSAYLAQRVNEARGILLKGK